MKLLRISIIRAIAAVVGGVLLLKYDADVLKVLTIVLGVVFLLAGVVSLVGWVNNRRKKADFRAYDNPKAQADDADPSVFPIAGLGSLLLGLILALTRRNDYVEWAMYLVGALLVLGALNMLMNLFSARKLEPVPAWPWLIPVAVVVAAIVAMLKGLVPANVCTTILGVTALVYAAGEVVLSFLLTGIRRRYEKTQAQVRRAGQVKAEAEDAQMVPINEEN